jgi:predicted transcriptional regulator YdeE
MDKQIVSQFHVVGISIRTTNANGQSLTDLAGLWAKFMSARVGERISNKVDNTIYCVYTNYENDFTRPYTALLGYKVEQLQELPEGLAAITIEKANYARFRGAGNNLQQVVSALWMDIWNLELPRKYTADFEVYRETAFNPEHAEMEVYVSVG